MGGREPDSDFEKWVADRLRLHGFEAEPQIGVAGFFIDIGVRHPTYPYGFLAGIECDGANYHSGKSVRDRDRLRQEILEGLGWRIYRVWSTDWFADPRAETEKLIAWLQESLKEAVRRMPQKPVSEEEPDEDKVVRLRRPVLVQNELPLATTSKSGLRDQPQEGPREAQPEPTTKEPESVDRARPQGTERVLDGSIFYYETYPGFYEDWIDGKHVADIEKRTPDVGHRATVYGTRIVNLLRTDIPR